MPGRPTGVNGEVMDEVMATGAVVAGRGTFEPADGWGGDHHDGVPIFILSRHSPPPMPRSGRWSPTSTTSRPRWPARRRRPARRTSWSTASAPRQLALAAGVLDEIQIHLVPVLLGEGRRLFEHLGADHIELEPIRVVEGDGVTHLRYRVRR